MGSDEIDCCEVDVEADSEANAGVSIGKNVDGRGDVDDGDESDADDVKADADGGDDEGEDVDSGAVGRFLKCGGT